ncbi:hypothetical protein CPB83DRAFT_88420 [Crepidotus variabilis]|uniref:N-acetyltransferase domain-containing protein n=1 Tax=Crepidotus variabilis TaxID=179855 RepID=A0A9P6E574_9AGAR|nr:hypothetical protein CPB83DRAFT_88420 [Crepidotus variabilis]
MVGKGKIHRIYTPSVQEIEKLVNIAVGAYRGLTAERVMLGGNEALGYLQFRSMIRASLLDGEVYVLENDAKDLVAFSIWFPPGKVLYGTPDQRSLGFEEFMEQLDDETREWYDKTYNPAINKWAPTWIPKPYPDCWWLAALATDPVHQRKGYGTLLLKHAIQMIPASNVLGLVSTLEETVHRSFGRSFCSDHYIFIQARFYVHAGIPIQSRMDPDLPSKFGEIPFYGHYREQL